MAIRVNIGGQQIIVKDTDDPVLAEKIAKRELKKRTGEYSTFGELFGTGPIWGIQTGMFQGPTQTISTALDWAFGTDMTSGVEDFFTKYKVDKPISPLGQISGTIFQLAAPAGVATKLTRAKYLKKAKAPGRKPFGKPVDRYVKKPERWKHTILPIGVADYAAFTADVPTFFDISNTKDKAFDDLDNREKAAKRMGHKLEGAIEGATILLGAPVIWKQLKNYMAGEKGLTRELADISTSSKAMMASAKWIQNRKANLAKAMQEGQYKGKKFKMPWKEYDLYQDILYKFRSQGAFPTKEAMDAHNAKAWQIGDEMHRAEANLHNMAEGYKWLAKSGEMSDYQLRSVINYLDTAVYGKSELIRQAAMRNLQRIDKDFMSKKRWFKSVTEEIDPKTGAASWRETIVPKFSFAKNARFTRQQVDSLSKQLPEFEKVLPKSFLDAVDINMGRYGYQLYKAFLKGEKYAPKLDSPEWIAARKEVLQHKLVKTSGEADEMLSELLKQGSFDNAYMLPKYSLEGIKMGLLKDKKLTNYPAIRKFLGEVKGETLPDLMLKNRSTIDNLARLTSGLRYMDEIASINARLSPRTSFVSGPSMRGGQAVLKEVGEREGRFLYDKIDDIPQAKQNAFKDETGMPIRIPDEARFGDIRNKITTRSIADAITGAQRGWLEQDPGGLSRAWGAYLAMKGLVQQSKTIYSPITQVRNATSASLFALMNGNIASRQDLQDSMMIVFDSLRKTQGTKMNEYYSNAMRRGVVQSGAIAAEIQGVIDDAVRAMELNRTAGLGKKLTQARNNLAARIYMGSDDVWKIFSWEMEKGKLARAFENASVRLAKEGKSFKVSPGSYKMMSDRTVREVEGADGIWNNFSKKTQRDVIEDIGASIARDTVPNYSKVPAFIKALRRTPFGNFIAFPSEIIRTSVNSASRAIDEIASGVPEIAEIGMRRLMGNLAVMYAVPKATVTFGKWMTGAVEEQIEAYKRSFAMPWEKNADLVPLQTDENGNIVEFYNYTYTNPYEYLRAPILAVFNAVANGETRGEKLHEILWNMFVGSRKEKGMLREYAEPFFGESIATTALLDAQRNITYTSGSPRKIYNEVDSGGLKLAKTLAHIANLALPPVVPVKFRPGEPSPMFLKGLPRSALYAAGLTDKPFARKGKKPDFATQLAESFTGLKTIRPILERTLKYRAHEAKDEMNEAVSYYTAVGRDPNILDPEDHVKALMRTNEARFSAIRDVSMAVEDARKLGMTDEEIYDVLKESKISKPEAIMNRLFIPYFPSEYQIKRVLEKEGAVFPEAELRQSFLEELRPTLPRTSFVGPGFVPPRAPRRLTAQQKAARDPRGSAAVLLRQRELEKMLGIN